MPYSLRGDCVYKENEKLKCYDNHEDALKYFQALEINVRNSTPIAELSMYISKVSVDKGQGGVMRWRATASDTSPDLYQERMSNELYDDFISRIDSGSTVPAPFDKALGEEWKGGMPYVSISHYKSGTGAKNVPGMPEKIYRDGNTLKAVGTLHDNEIGRAVFKSLCDDLYSEKSKKDGKVRISIGFLDLEHKHLGEGKSPDYTFTRKGLTDNCPMCQEGKGNKVYTKGQLVHLALTRVPVNPRTAMEVSKAMAIETKKQDAESIIGKELSDTLEEKSLLSHLLVTKSDNPLVEDAKRNDVNPKEGEHKYGDVKFADETNKKYPIDTEEHIRAAWNYIHQQKNADKYPDKGKAIKGKIAGAWKRVIGGEPPSAVAKSMLEDKVEEKANLKLGLPGQEPGLGLAIGGGVADGVDSEEALEGDVKAIGGGGDNEYDEGELDGEKKVTGNVSMKDMRPIAKAKVASDKQSEELTYTEPDESKREDRRDRPAGEKSMTEKSALAGAFEKLHSKVEEMKSQGMPAETALREIQPFYNAVGEEVKRYLNDAPKVPEGMGTEINELKSIVKSLAETVSTLQQTMSTEIATLKAQTLSGTGAVRQLAQGIPMPRSLSGNNLPAQQVQVPPLAGVPDSIRNMAFKSTFGK